MSSLEWRRSQPRMPQPPQSEPDDGCDCTVCRLVALVVAAFFAFSFVCSGSWLSLAVALAWGNIASWDWEIELHDEW